MHLSHPRINRTHPLRLATCWLFLTNKVCLSEADQIALLSHDGNRRWEILEKCKVTLMTTAT